MTKEAKISINSELSVLLDQLKRKDETPEMTIMRVLSQAPRIELQFIPAQDSELLPYSRSFPSVRKARKWAQYKILELENIEGNVVSAGNGDSLVCHGVEPDQLFKIAS